MNQDAYPFDAALEVNKVPHQIHSALVEVCDTVDMAKKILLQNRVRDFTAKDVIALTQMIFEREAVLTARADHGTQEDDDAGVF